MLHTHSPYDTIFVALAEREGVKLVTFDEPLRRKFPMLTIAPPDALAGGAEASRGPS